MKAAIVQDVRDNRVLMLAWLNEEAERLMTKHAFSVANADGRVGRAATS